MNSQGYETETHVAHVGLKLWRYMNLQGCETMLGIEAFKISFGCI